MPFDVRIIAATNRNLTQAIGKGSFREDLYYRLAVFTIAMPALRERTSDIPLLAQRFVSEFRTKHQTPAEGIRDSALALLKKIPLARKRPGTAQHHRTRCCAGRWTMAGRSAPASLHLRKRGCLGPEKSY